MEAFAARWIAGWNARDIDAVLAPFADDARFISPLATGLTGMSIIHGKQALRLYWLKALEAAPSLRFTLISTICDVDRQELALHYMVERNGQAMRAMETIRFAKGRPVEGQTFFGTRI